MKVYLSRGASRLRGKEKFQTRSFVDNGCKRSLFLQEDSVTKQTRNASVKLRPLFVFNLKAVQDALTTPIWLGCV